MTRPLSPWRCAQFRDRESRDGFVDFLDSLSRDGIRDLEYDRIEHSEAPGCWYRAPTKIIDSIGNGVQALGGTHVVIDRDAM